jgi:transcription elongation factor Elf1
MTLPVEEYAEIECPYCGEPQTVNIELLHEQQSYTEDCQICCRPMLLHIGIDFDTQQVQINAQREND